jgi:hypothetical protein
VALHDLVEPLAGQRPPAKVDERPPLRARPDQHRAPSLDVAAQRGDRGAAEGHEPLARPLALGPQRELLEIEIADFEADGLGRAQPGGVHGLEQRAVAQGERLGAPRLLEQPVDLVAAEHVREPGAAAGRGERGGRVLLEQVLAPQVAVEGAQRRGLAVDGGGRGARAVVAGHQAGQVVGEVGAGGVEDGQSPLGEEAAHLQEVGAVGLERVAREAALELEVGQEVEHQMLEHRRTRGRDRRHCARNSGRADGGLPAARALSAGTAGEAPERTETAEAPVGPSLACTTRHSRRPARGSPSCAR